jgi:hypothetical protein
MIFHKWFQHGDLNDVTEEYDIITEKGESAQVRKQPPPKPPEQPETPPKPPELSAEEEKNIRRNGGLIGLAGSTSEGPVLQQDDEALRKIYETLAAIRRFEAKTQPLRNLIFAKSDETI